MDINTVTALKAFLSSIPEAVCLCSMHDLELGHRKECRYEEMQERVDVFIEAFSEDHAM